MTDVQPEDRPTFQVVFRAESHCPDPIKALRPALKHCARAYGLKCIDAKQLKSKESS